MCFTKSWLSFLSALNCFMECNNIIIFFFIQSFIFLFQRAGKKKSALFQFLTWCSSIVERLWKKDSVLSSVHSFLHTLSLKPAMCWLLLSAFTVSFAISVTQGWSKVSDLPFGFYWTNKSCGAACFLQLLLQVANVEILGRTSHLFIESAVLGQDRKSVV